jgi:hypothetical protein
LAPFPQIYAHKDLGTVSSGRQGDFLSSHDEVRALIQLAHDTWNHYSYVWNASTSSDKIIAADDYKWLFRHLRRGTKLQTVRDRRQFKRLSSRYLRCPEQPFQASPSQTL